MIDGSFAAAKKGACSRKNQRQPGYEADGGGKRPGYFSRRLPLFGFTGGSGLGRGHIGLTRANVLDPAFDADKADESQSDANDGPINRLS